MENILDRQMESWKYTCESIQRGPRCVEIPYVLNNLISGSVLEIGGHESQIKYPIIRKDVPYTLIDPLGTIFLGSKHNLNVNCIKGDIRKYTARQLGKYNNVIMLSVLEHIGLSAYGQKEDWKKHKSPAAAQAIAFKHCMRFVNKNGRMICTLPFGKLPEGMKEEDSNFLIRYNKEMLNVLYKGYNLIDESFFILSEPIVLLRWKQVKEEETLGFRANVCFILENK